MGGPFTIVDATLQYMSLELGKQVDTETWLRCLMRPRHPGEEAMEYRRGRSKGKALIKAFSGGLAVQKSHITSGFLRTFMDVQ